MPPKGNVPRKTTRPRAAEIRAPQQHQIIHERLLIPRQTLHLRQDVCEFWGGEEEVLSDDRETAGCGIEGELSDIGQRAGSEVDEIQVVRLGGLDRGGGLFCGGSEMGGYGIDVCSEMCAVEFPLGWDAGGCGI